MLSPLLTLIIVVDPVVRWALEVLERLPGAVMVRRMMAMLINKLLRWKLNRVPIRELVEIMVLKDVSGEYPVAYCMNMAIHQGVKDAGLCAMAVVKKAMTIGAASDLKKS